MAKKKDTAHLALRLGRKNKKLEGRIELLAQTLRLAKTAIVWLAANRKGNLHPPQPDIVEQIENTLWLVGANGYQQTDDPIESMGLTGATRDPDFSDEPR
jgi:hypothetical protein